MNKFSKRSLKNLKTCDERLQAIAHDVLGEMDIAVICGHRDEFSQNEAFERGLSKKKWPNSKHNSFPSRAMDIVPYPVDWNDIERFEKMLAIVERAAEKLGTDIRLGKAWGDYPHVELV